MDSYRRVKLPIFNFNDVKDYDFFINSLNKIKNKC